MKKKNNRNAVIIAVVVFVAGMLIGAYLPRLPAVQEPVQRAEIEGERKIEMLIPAVDVEGNGVVGKLITRIRPGSGQVLVNVNDVLAQFDTQLSGRTAAKAASATTRKNLSSIDVIYDIQVNASIVEGPSAGASMAASIVLALEEIPANASIAMTGGILENGTISRVGAILEKGIASKEAGAEIFLVPSGEGTELKSSRTKNCAREDSIEICQIKYSYNPVSIGSSLNMTVEEVGTLEDAVEIFRKHSGKENVAV